MTFARKRDPDASGGRWRDVWTRVEANCEMYRSGDQWLCRCGLSADLNDDDPPLCPRTGKAMGRA